MEVKVLLCADEKLLKAINNLSSALGGSKLTAKVDQTEISDTAMAKSEEENEKYTMFQDMAKAAKKLQAADEESYEEILYSYVDEGQKYSAILAKDWGKATKDFKKALADLSKKPAKKKAEEDVENEEVNLAAETMYYIDTMDDTIGIIKKGAEIPDNEDIEFITKAQYLKKKKEAETTEDEDDDNFGEDEAPRLDVNALRALASRASNAGVKVGAILNKIGGTKKVSALDPSVYNAVEDALRKEMKKMEA